MEAISVEPRSKIETWIPGLATLRTYKREWFTSDFVAGLSVAAVALPIGIAYAQLAGFSPVVGIYSCILPAVAYALFGSSRQLVVNPDAAACAIVAATIAPLAAGDVTKYADLSIILTLITGIFCVIGGFVGLGAIANFLSRPILTGYLNGIALSIIAGQLGTLLGFKVPSHGIFRTLYEVGSRLRETHFRTLLLGLSLFIFIRILKRTVPRIPAPLIAAVLGCLAVYFLGLASEGVGVVGPVPPGFPSPRIPSIHGSELGSLMFGACGIMLVSFCSMMTTARGFAAKNGYSINVNQDMIALGVSDLASGLSTGFVVSGADSRTAVADASGGKTQVTTVVAAVVMAIVLIFLATPLAYLPTAALAAILISSALSLFDFTSLRRYYRINSFEFRFALVAMLGVMTVGVLPGVLIAVGLSFLKLVRMASRPRDVVMGLVGGTDDVYSSLEHEGVTSIPGLLIFRFEASLLFFNADHFKDRVQAAIASAKQKPRWFMLDAEAMPILDITGAETLESLRTEFANQNIKLVIAEARGFCFAVLRRSGLPDKIGNENLFPTVHYGVQTFRSTESCNVS
jgi:high affinity sulfate transporter 1